MYLQHVQKIPNNFIHYKHLFKTRLSSNFPLFEDELHSTKNCHFKPNQV